MPFENFESNAWDILFEHTPKAVRWILGILTLGIFTLLGVLYRWHREDLRRMHERMDRMERRVDERFDEFSTHLIEIARNTKNADR